MIKLDYLLDKDRIDMNAEIELIVKPEFIQDYQDGYPLISKESLTNLDKLKEEGSVINLVSSKGKFIAKGYYGIQNKGFGWVLSQSIKEKIDKEYFKKQLDAAIKHREELFCDEATTAFRVFNGEGDGVGGITIDFFNGFYLITWYSLGIYEFKADILEALKESV